MNYKSYRHRFGFVFLFVAAFLSSSCGNSPRPSQGQKHIEELIAKNSRGFIKLVDFRKTNGTVAELMGVKLYEMEFEADIEFANDCTWRTNFAAQEVQSSADGYWAQYAQSLMQMAGQRNAQKGERATITGKMQFEKKERGWFVDGIRVLKVQTTSSGQSRNTSGTPQPDPVTTISDFSKNLTGSWDFGSWGSLELNQNGKSVTGIQSGANFQYPVHGTIADNGVVNLLIDEHECPKSLIGTINKHGTAMTLEITDTCGYASKFNLLRKQ